MLALNPKPMAISRLDLCRRPVRQARAAAIACPAALQPENPGDIADMASPIIDFLLDPQFRADPGIEGAGADDAEIETMTDASPRACPTTAGWRPGASSSIAARRAQEIGERLAELAEQREGPLPEGRRNQELARFSRAPLVIGVISSPKENPKIPQWEMFLSGRRGGDEPGDCRQRARLRHQLDHQLVFRLPRRAARILGLAPHERVVGFVHIGTFAGQVPERPRPDVATLVSDYTRPVGGMSLVLRADERPRPAARSVQGDRRAAADRLDLDAGARRARSTSRPIRSSTPFRPAPSSSGSPPTATRTASPSRARAASSSSTSSARDLAAKMNPVRSMRRAASASSTMPVLSRPRRVLVKPPRVAGAPAALECKVTEIFEPKDLEGRDARRQGRGRRGGRHPHRRRHADRRPVRRRQGRQCRAASATWTTASRHARFSRCAGRAGTPTDGVLRVSQSPRPLPWRAGARRASDAGGRTSGRRCRRRPDCRHPRMPATIACERATASAEGVKAALMTGTCAGWIAILAVKPSRSASMHSAATPRCRGN